MSDQAPSDPRIYHIVHIDRLASIVADGCLWCDAEVVRRQPPGSTIGMSRIKTRRLEELSLASHPGLTVGDCVPFYFCPRSVMLYMIHRGGRGQLQYSGGQGPIVHLAASVKRTVAWAEAQGRRWAFTLSNAGAFYFEDRADLARLDDIDWAAVDARKWAGRDVPASIKEGKQAEFLVEKSFAWDLVETIGVSAPDYRDAALDVLQSADSRPVVEVRPDWYY